MKIFFILITILFLSTPAWAVYSLPNDDNDCPDNCRVIEWDVGLDQHGGITNYTGVSNAVTEHSADNTGASNAHTEIQACLDNSITPGGCYLPDGTYNIAGKIIVKSEKVLRGQSRSGTTLALKSGGSIDMDDGTKSFGSELDMTVDPDKGDTTFTLVATTGLAVGDYISIYQDNDAGLDVDRGRCGHCGEDTGSSEHFMQQFAKITVISGNDVTVDRPLYYDYNDSANDAAVKEVNFNVVSAGIEDLTVDGSAVDTRLIHIEHARHSWIKNVQTYMAGSNSQDQHIRLRWTHAIEIRDSLIHYGKGFLSGANYGIHLLFWNSDLKIENNVITDTRHAINFEGGGSGSAVLYNYIDNGYEGEGDDFLSADLNPNHGPHPHMNLYEGNSSAKITHDWTLGGSSHNVSFRNHVRGDRATPAITWGIWAIDTQNQNNYMSFVGNVIGLSTWTSGTVLANGDCSPAEPNVFRFGCTGQPGSYSSATAFNTAILHGNYDYITDGVALWQGGADHDLKDSMYYDAEPSWWQDLSEGGKCRPWPPIGVDTTSFVTDIPAKDAYEGETYNIEDCPTGSDPPVVSITKSAPLGTPNESSATSGVSGIFEITITDDGSGANVSVEWVQQATGGTWGAEVLNTGTSMIISSANSGITFLQPQQGFDFTGASIYGLNLVLPSGATYTISPTNSGATFTSGVSDDDISEVSAYVVDGAIGEGSGTATIQISCNTCVSGLAGVTYVFTGTADNKEGGDVTGVTYPTISIVSDTVGFNIVVTAVDDSEVEGPETLILTLQDQAGYDLLDTWQVTITIIDNDTATLTVDDFEDSSVGSFWTYTDSSAPSPGSSDESGTTHHLNSGDGRVYAGDYQPSFLYQPVTGDFSVWTEVHHTPLTAACQKLGLLFKPDSGVSHVQIMRDWTSGGTRFNVTHTVDSNSNQLVTTNSIDRSWLRMDRTSGIIESYYATANPLSGGGTWVSFDPTSGITLITTEQGNLGIYAASSCGGGGGTPLEAYFEFFDTLPTTLFKIISKGKIDSGPGEKGRITSGPNDVGRIQ